MEKKTPIGIQLTGGRNNTVSNCYAIGFDRGFVIENEEGTKLENNVAISVDGMRLFSEARSAIDASAATDNVKAEARSMLTALQSSIGQASFASRYGELMSLLSNHATVFSTALPIVSTMWKAFTSS